MSSHLAPSIFVRMDEDTAGQGAVAWINSISQAVKCIQVPYGTDVNDFYLIMGRENIRNWLLAFMVYFTDCKFIIVP